MKVKIPDSRVPRAGVALLVLWAAWSVYATFFTRPNGETWTMLHRLCGTGSVGRGRVHAILSNPYWSTECSRLSGAYTAATVVFWVGFLLLGWYFGAKLLNVVLAKPDAKPGQGSAEQPQ